MVIQKYFEVANHQRFYVGVFCFDDVEVDG
jgi:hypothetical protein